MKTRLLFAFVLLMAGSKAIHAQPKVTSTVSAKQVLVNETFTWTVEVTGGDEMPNFKLPDIAKVAVVSGPSQSSNYSYVNGKMSSKKSLSYTFVALEPGEIVIPALVVQLGKQKARTAAVKVQILNSRSGKKKVAGGGQQVFVRAIPSKKEVFLGEPVTVRYKLFTKVGVYNYHIEKLPDAVGFWAEEVSTQTQPRLVSEIVNGERYNTATLKTVLYYPTRTGELTIDPLKTELEVEVQTRNQTRRSLFNDPFFGNSRKVNRDFLTRELKINVNDLPQPRPANFAGAVGKFRLKANLDTNAVFTNDAVGLTLTLTGQGNFKSLKLPEPNIPEGVDVFKPERSESIKIQNGKHSGYKKATYLLVPRQAGEIVIDPIEFTYFDLNAEKYITKSSGWIKLAVYDAEDNQALVTSGYSRREVELMQDDIRYIKPVSSRFFKLGSVRPGFFVWGHLGGLFFLVIVLAWDFQRGRLEGNSELKRRTQAMKISRGKLKLAEKQKDNPETLQALLNQAIVGFIGARLSVAENALDNEAILQTLRDHEVSEDITLETRAFLEGLTMDRFAPGAIQRTPEEWIEVGRSLLQKLGRTL